MKVWVYGRTVRVQVKLFDEEDASGISGYPYAWPIEDREGYRFAVVAQQGYTTCVARIALPNPQSGFDGWIDVGYWQRLL